MVINSVLLIMMRLINVHLLKNQIHVIQYIYTNRLASYLFVEFKRFLNKVTNREFMVRNKGLFAKFEVRKKNNYKIPDKISF